MEQIKISFNLNGQDVSVLADPNKRLVDFLREDMGMLSVKEGCGEVFRDNLLELLQQLAAEG